jgi:Glycosyltransferase family 9 (heptosyltransferase)
MKKAVVTIASGEYYQRMAAITHPNLRAYAEKIGADLIVWSDTSGYKIPAYKKTEIAGLLNEYGRVLYVDTDIIIRDDAPDIFAVVPEDHLGMLEEVRHVDRREATQLHMRLIGYSASVWEGKYYNTGVLVCSACHRDLFVMPPVEVNDFREPTWISMVVNARKMNVFQLPHRLNRLASLDSLYGDNRLDAWFLHYAGATAVPMQRERLLELIAHDLQTWRQTGPAYRFRKNVAIEVQGGLGDQIAAEPAVRYARDVIYRDDNLVLVSSWPEVFRHLDLPVHSQFDRVPQAAGFRRRYTRANPAARHKLSLHQIHGTNLASHVALGVDLPLACKTPRLSVDPAALARLVRPRDVDSLVLLHPGRGAAADTFPPDVWQSFANILTDHGFHVAVIGNREDAQLAIVEFDRSKCIDLTDKLTTRELIALISRARVLVANDSAPVQIAGAFDGWIGLIATLRHPEYVLPWRNGSQFYRARNLERAELYADYVHKPSGSRNPDLAVCDQKRLRACLPEPSAILEFVESAFAET